MIASDGPQQVLLQKELPNHKFIPLPGYKVRYSKSKGWLPYKIMQQLPALLRIVQWEHRWLKEAVQQYNIDLVISDNRYGLWNKHCISVFITHQLTIKAPVSWLEKFIQQVNYRYINRFNACWVPDVVQNGGLAGVLSHPQKLPAIPVHYIGLLSRFTMPLSLPKKQITIVLSGPEPQRTLLEEKLIIQLAGIQRNIVLVRGLPDSNSFLNVPAHIKVIHHLTAEALQEELLKSELVIARSGYSSLMDFARLQLKTILVPTPGQTEQEYLAALCEEKKYAYIMHQSEMNLKQMIETAEKDAYSFPAFDYFDGNKLKDLLATLPQNHLS
jgi:UDP-N-acetylglucosamine transferase subunit ALG13